VAVHDNTMSERNPLPWRPEGARLLGRHRRERNLRRHPVADWVVRARPRRRAWDGLEL